MSTTISDLRTMPDANTVGEVLHGRDEDRREAEYERRAADAELMQDTFQLQAEKSLIQDEDFLVDLLAEQSHATSRLALYTACPDLLQADYSDAQMILDENIVRTTVREWVQVATEEIKSEWIAGDCQI